MEKPTQLDDLIRGEMSAVKSIDTVLAKITDEKERSALTSMRQDHVIAVDRLKRFAGPDVLEDTDTSGPWGMLSSAFAGGASFFGDAAALKALKVGEVHGVNEYEEALEDETIQSELKQIIRSELLPNQQKHINIIDSYT